MTPQFHHLDAIVDNDRASTRAQREAENPPPETEARAVNMAVKSNDNEELDMGQVAKELRDIDEEPWQELEWIDEDVSKDILLVPIIALLKSLRIHAHSRCTRSN